MAQKFTAVELSTGWTFKQTDDSSADAWLPVKRVPTNVHLDLLDHGKIQDPFLGFNELACEWVADKSWTYKTTFSTPPADSSATTALVFDGLDTFATVRLNGKTILESDNMHIPHRLIVTDDLEKDGKNELEIDFASARLKAIEIKEQHPDHKWLCWNGDPARMAVRKAQYHWGWDWGPVLNTCGPWRAVRLETYSTRVEDMRIDYKLNSSFSKATGTISAVLDGCSSARRNSSKLSFSAKYNGKTVFEKTVEGTSCEFELSDPHLWYPHGYGEQPLYDFNVTLLADDGTAIASSSRRTGIRQADLVQELDKIGKSFYFRINGVDVFCGGSDWIPADNFTPRVTEEKYRKWLEMMVDGYQVMIRVWGGGIYEDDIFYDICDELGILVWQDFMFGCGNYPVFESLQKSIHAEAVANVRRLRSHPSMVIWAGNNEDYQLQESYELTYNWEDKNPDNWLKTDFPARYIYEKILPEVVQAESPHIPYHPGSPWSDGKLKTSDKTVGDMHQWNVWHGTQEKYQIFDTLGGRFNSEFGMEAFPHIDTIKYFCTDESQLFPQSHMLDFHNKADGHERRIATYLVENFRTVTDLEGFIHLTQLSQAEALMFGYRGWRRQWGQERRCGGALVWQLNDCWPVTSWAIVDYFLRKKPAYYAMRRVLAPVGVAVKRDHHDWSVVHARPVKSIDWECWVVSSKPKDFAATVELKFISIATGKDIKEPLKKEITVKANTTTDVLSGTINNESEEPHVLAARIFVNGEVVSRDVDWPQPLKYLDFSDRGVEVKANGDTISVKAAKPTKGLVFEERAGVLVHDSGLDVVPGDEQIVKVRGLGKQDQPLKWRFLGM